MSYTLVTFGVSFAATVAGEMGGQRDRRGVISRMRVVVGMVRLGCVEVVGLVMGMDLTGADRDFGDFGVSSVATVAGRSSTQGGVDPVFPFRASP